MKFNAYLFFMLFQAFNENSVGTKEIPNNTTNKTIDGKSIQKNKKVYNLPKVNEMVGGHVTHLESAPYIVKLETENNELICAGTLMSSLTVVTPCHCVAFNDSGITQKIDYDLVISLGAKLLSQDSTDRKYTQYRRAESIVIHPRCEKNDSFWIMDIAILKADKPFELDSRVKAVDRPPMKNVKSFVKSNIFLTMHCKYYGWNSGNNSVTLNQMNLAPIDLGKCYKILHEYTKSAKFVHFDRSLSCFKPNCKNCCIGDSGGPVVCNHQILGIISWSSNCTNKQTLPSIFFRIDGDVSFFFENYSKASKKYFYYTLIIVAIIILK